MSRPLKRSLTLPPSIPVRLVVVLLALLQFIAPTWHVCAMGGYGMPAECGMVHQEMQETTQAASSSPHALICYCAPHKEQQEPPGSQVSARIAHREMTCLALLLQSMPGQVAATPSLLFSFTMVEAVFSRPRENAPALAILRRYRGRAPPITA